MSLFKSDSSLSEVLRQFAPKTPSFGQMAGSIGSSMAPSSTANLFRMPEPGTNIARGPSTVAEYQARDATRGWNLGPARPDPGSNPPVKFGKTRPSTSRISSGGAMPQLIAGPTTIEFSRGVAPTLQGLELPMEEFTRRLEQVNQPEQLASLAERYNAPTRQAFESYLPGFRSNLAALSGLAQDALVGRLPLPVTQEIARSTAQANLQTGLFGGGLGRRLTARDLGRSVLELQQTGADLLGRSVGLTQQAMQLATPISVANLMVSPQQVYDTMMSQAQYNQQIANANLLNAWQSQPLPGQYVLGRGFQTFTPGQYASTRPLAPGTSLTSGRGIMGAAANNLARNWTGYAPQQQLAGV